MFKMFKRFFQVLATLVSTFEASAKTIEHIAAAAEKSSEQFLLETQLRQKQRLDELKRQTIFKDLSPPVSTRLDLSPANRTEHAVTRTAPPAERWRQLEAARVAAVKPSVKRIEEQLLGNAAGGCLSQGVLEAPPHPPAIEYVERLDAASIAHDRLPYILLRPRFDRAPVGNGEARDIQDLVARRGIKHLFHFTREANLPSILRCGLVTRDVLRAEGQESNCNDRYRLDGTDAVCASIGFPNYKMFFSLRQENKDVDWILLTIEPSVLWNTKVAFCAANAASRAVTEIPLQQRMRPAAMEAMFTDFGDKARSALNLPDSLPTNPQAEVLLLDGVPRRYISGAIAVDEEQKIRIEADRPDLKVIVNAGWYRWRPDYEHWK